MDKLTAMTGSASHEELTLLYLSHDLKEKIDRAILMLSWIDNNEPFNQEEIRCLCRRVRANLLGQEFLPVMKPEMSVTVTYDDSLAS